MDLTVFKADVNLAEEGAWTEVTFRGQTGDFKIARAGNTNFNRVYTHYRQMKRFADMNSTESVEYDRDCITRALAEAILMDTGNEITQDGEPIKYTPELGYKLLSDPAYQELRNQISIASGDFEVYAAITLEEVLGN